MKLDSIQQNHRKSLVCNSTLIQKGDQDCTVPIENTKMLADALSAAGMDGHYDLLKNVGHGDGLGTSCAERKPEAHA
jgi:predicted esterase